MVAKVRPYSDGTIVLPGIKEIEYVEVGEQFFAVMSQRKSGNYIDLYNRYTRRFILKISLFIHHTL